MCTITINNSLFGCYADEREAMGVIEDNCKENGYAMFEAEDMPINEWTMRWIPAVGGLCIPYKKVNAVTPNGRNVEFKIYK